MKVAVGLRRVAAGKRTSGRRAAQIANRANDLLDGKNSTASKFGCIRYYEDDDILKWCNQLKLKEVYGIRTFWGLQQNQTQHAFEEWQHRMEELELRVAKIDEFRKIAFFHHLIFVKE